MIEDHDDVGVLDGAEAVGDDEDGASGHEGVHALLDHGLGVGIDGGGSLIHDHHRWVGDGGTRDGEQLALTLREVRAVRDQHRVVALRQSADEAVGTGELRGGHTLFVRRVELSVADVLHDGPREKHGILQDDAEGLPEGSLLDILDIDAVIGDGALLDLVETVDEVRDGRLTGTGGTDERDLLTRAGVDIDLMQNRVLPVVGEVHVAQDDVALETFVRHAAVSPDLLPGPLLGALLALLDLPVPLMTAHERHRALILLRLLIHQREDTTRTRETHDDRIDLLRDTADLTGELSLHVEERHGNADAEGHTAQAEVRHLQEKQRAAGEGQHNIEHVSDISEDWHQGIRVAVRLL